MYSWKRAFTLAEVLIVIGIIGVVAAITIPTIVSFFKDKVDTNRKEVIKGRLIQGMNQLNTLDDGFNASQYAQTGTEGFVKALSAHYKMSQICGANDLKSCFPYTSLTYNKSDNTEAQKNWSELKTPEDFGLESSKYYAPAGFISANGTPFVMLLKKDCIMDNGTGMRTIPTNCVAYMYDRNGSNIPNKFDSDLVHSEDIAIGKLFPKAILGGANGVKIMTNAFVPTPLEATDCSTNKATYGITNCRSGNDDYWGGAMKYCKSQGLRLPTETELATIANALYTGMQASATDSLGSNKRGTNNASIGSNEPVPDALSGLSSSWYILWSGSEDSSSYAYLRYFGATSSFRDSNGRDGSVRAVCVSD